MANRTMNRRRFLKHSAAATAGAAVATAIRPGSAQTPINPGAVGVITHEGGAHLGHYFGSLAQTEEVTSVVLSDPSGKSVPGARKALGEKLAGVYSEPAVMLQEAKPVMALVSMEPSTAAPAIDAALDAGCHVFAEKPACLRIDDFRPLVAKANQRGRYLMLALANRLHPAVQEARRLVRAGEIGKIFGLEMHLIADQTRLTSSSYHASWYAQRSKAGGGHLIWLGIHWLDLATYLTGSKIRDVSAFTANVGGQPVDIEDSAAVTVRFDNGTLGTHTSGYYLDRGYHEHIKIWGSSGWLHLDLLADVPLHWSSTRGDRAGQIQEFTAPNAPTGYPPFVRAAFRACVGLQQPPITADESLDALNHVFAAYESARTGKAQRVG
ncbi:Gfo/Idh/MocA family protein [Planctomycetota bacterium]